MMITRMIMVNNNKTISYSQLLLVVAEGHFIISHTTIRRYFINGIGGALRIA
jgi:hypothetical protein